jgi:hypothetical protein
MPAQAKAALCRYISIEGGAALGAFAGGAAGSFFTPIGTAAGRSGGALIGEAAGAALAAAWCPTGSPTAGNFPLYKSPPFLGGQCSGSYTVFFENITQYPGREPENLSGSDGATGPITNVYVTTTPQAARLFIVDAYGARQISGVFTGSGTQSLSLKVTRVERDGGLPDNCGNMPGYDGPVIPRVPDDIPPINTDPAARNPIDIDVDFGGTVVNVKGDLVLTGPTFTGDGLGIGFNFDGLDFTLKLNGDIDIGPGNSNPQEPDDEGDDAAKQLDGLFYRVTHTASNQSSDLVESGKYFYPRFGSVAFFNDEFMSEQIPMNGENGYIPNPLPQYFTQFRFTPYRATNRAKFYKQLSKICCFAEDKKKE